MERRQLSQALRGLREEKLAVDDALLRPLQHVSRQRGRGALPLLRVKGKQGLDVRNHQLLLPQWPDGRGETPQFEEVEMGKNNDMVIFSPKPPRPKPPLAVRFPRTAGPKIRRGTAMGRASP